MFITITGCDVILKLQLTTGKETDDVLQLVKMTAGDADVALHMDGLETEMGNTVFVIATVQNLHVTEPIDQLPAPLVGVGKAELPERGGSTADAVETVKRKGDNTAGLILTVITTLAVYLNTDLPSTQQLNDLAEHTVSCGSPDLHETTYGNFSDSYHLQIGFNDYGNGSKVSTSL